MQTIYMEKNKIYSRMANLLGMVHESTILK